MGVRSELVALPVLCYNTPHWCPPRPPGLEAAARLIAGERNTSIALLGFTLPDPVGRNARYHIPLRRGANEASLPTQTTQTAAHARFPPKNEDQGRSPGARRAPRPRAQAPLRFAHPLGSETEIDAAGKAPPDGR